MSNNVRLRRQSIDNPDTVERARKRIAAVATAEGFELMREDRAVAEGWIGALHVEGLLSKELYEVLDAELDKAAAEWEDPV
jgi:hypothetical protein